MFHRKPGRVILSLFASLIVAFTIAIASPLAAQDDDAPYEAFVYAGTLEDLESATRLGAIGDLEDEADRDENLEHWERVGMGQAMPDELYSEDEDLRSDLSLATIFNDPHLVIVHATADSSSPIIAVGAIQGDVDGMGGILIELDEYDSSGFEGRAWVGPEFTNDSNGYEVEIIVAIYPVGSVERIASPAATPST
jgi:hypothetical protein